MSSADRAPGLIDESASGSESPTKERPLCSADIHGFNSNGQTLLALTEVQKTPGLSKEMDAYIEKVANNLAQGLDTGTRHDDVTAALTKAQADIKGADRANATAIYTELLRRIDRKETKFKGDDLTLKMDSGTQTAKDASIISGDLNKKALSVAKLLDNNHREEARIEFFKAVGGKSLSIKVDFAFAVDAFEKDEPVDDVTILYDETNKPDGYKINIPPKNQDKLAAEAAKEGKKLPKGDEPIPFDKLLSKYKTSIGDAYARSKSAADNDPAKSKTLEEAVERLQRSISQVNIVFSNKAGQDEYDPDTHTITIGSGQQSAAKQIEAFTHEAYHATHQGCKELYLGKKLSKEEYVKLKGDIEAACLETEVKVYRELTSKMGSTSVLFPYIKKDGQPDIKDLVNLYAKEGKAGLVRFIMEDGKAEFVKNGQVQLLTYKERISSSYYQDYGNDQTFSDKSAMIRYRYNTPNSGWRKLIDDGF